MTPPKGMALTTDALKRLVMLDPLFQKSLAGAFSAGRAGGALDFELAVLLHTQMCRMFSQLPPDEQEAVVEVSSQYFDTLYGTNDEVV